MNGITAYKIYRSLRLHFTSDTYDFFKYKFNIKVSPEAYNRKNDKYFFEKLAKIDNLPSYLLANFRKKPYYVLDLIDTAECRDNYAKWKGVMSALSYHFKNDLAKLSDDFEHEVRGAAMAIPFLLERVMVGDINAETLCLIMHYTGLNERWNEEGKDNICLMMGKQPIIKYMPFVQKKDKYFQILIDKYPNIKYK